MSRGKTDFTFRGSQYIFNVLAQGLKNAGNHFQSTLLSILSGIPVTVYIDDILLRKYGHGRRAFEAVRTDARQTNKGRVKT